MQYIIIIIIITMPTTMTKKGIKKGRNTILEFVINQY